MVEQRTPLLYLDSTIIILYYIIIKKKKNIHYYLLSSSSSFLKLLLLLLLRQKNMLTSQRLRSLAAQHARRLQRRKCIAACVRPFRYKTPNVYPPVDVHTRRACLISRTANAYRARPPDIELYDLLPGRRHQAWQRC